MKKVKPKVALFLNHPECSAQCAVGMYEALSSHYQIDMFKSDQFDGKIFARADIIAFPGGLGDSETYRRIIGDNYQYVQDAVNNGVRYLGICMGAYWAGPYYFNLLEGIDTVQYIKRPRSGIKRSFGTTVPVDWHGEIVDMYFYDGTAFLGDETQFYTVARYKNKDPMAIIQNRIGIIGCHPESMKSWYNKHDSLKAKWHENYHHRLLLNFTNLLMEC